MGAIASFEQGSAISVPLRFLLTAPIYGVAAGLLLAWLGADAFSSRWSPGAAALTHLLTAGFMLQAMLGALLPLIPVAAGGNVWRPKLLAATVHCAITIGAVLLGGSLLVWYPDGLWYGAVLLGSGSGAYALAIGMALLRTRAAGATVRALRGSVAGLVVTVVLGVALVETMTGSLRLAFVETADLHAAWGLGGWAMLLLTGVSMQVVPMFQLTPSYPVWLGRVLVPGILASLIAASVLAVWARSSDWQGVAVGAGLLLAMTFAVAIIWLQQRRRRLRADVTFYLFRSAMLCLLAAGGLFALLWTPGEERAPLAILLDVLVLVGVFVTAINGMLYKIVPFLCSLELQRQELPKGRSRMLYFISNKAMNGQHWLHLIALALLFASTALPPVTRAAGFAFAAACAWLEWNLVVAVRRCQGLKGPIREGAAAGGS